MGLNFFFQYIVIWNIEKWLSKFYFFIPLGTCLLKIELCSDELCILVGLSKRGLIKIQKQNNSSKGSRLYGLKCVKVSNNSVVYFLVATHK